MQISTGGTPLPQLLKNSQDFLKWANEVEAHVGTGNWVELSVRKMEAILAEPSDSQKRKLVEGLYGELVENQHNVSDLIHLNFMHQNIGVQNGEMLKLKLSDALKGASSIRTERPEKTQPRDTMFELSICARLNERGFFTLLYDPNPDLIAYYRNQHLAIEFKRVFSSKRIDDQIISAHEQLRDRSISQRTDYRVIFLDVTRTFTQGRLHLQGERVKIIQELAKGLEKSAEPIMRLMERYNMSSSVDAVVLIFQDYAEPTEDEYVLLGITQSLIIINPMHGRTRRRKLMYLLRRLDPKGKITLGTLIRTPSNN